MQIKSLKLVYFSPTGTTRKVLKGISEGIGIGNIEDLDLTPPDAKNREFSLNKDQLALIGAPVYGGRIPSEAAFRLGHVKGNKTPAVVVVLYGNREYEGALRELHDLAVETGFIPLAWGAFIGEHSFSNNDRPIAKGRPDEEDLNIAKEFGRSIQDKIQSLEKPDGEPIPEIPGNRPFKERKRGMSHSAPITHEDICVKCNTCAEVCPTGAIFVDETVMTDGTKCISCCACVKNCAVNARVIVDEGIKRITEWLYNNYSTRKFPETYL